MEQGRGGGGRGIPLRFSLVSVDEQSITFAMDVSVPAPRRARILWSWIR